MRARFSATVLCALGLFWILPPPYSPNDGHLDDVVIVRFYVELTPTAAEIFEARFLVRYQEDVASGWHLYAVLDGATLSDKRSWILEDALVCSVELWPDGLSREDLTASLEAQPQCSEPDTARLERINRDYAGTIPISRSITVSEGFAFAVAAIVSLALLALIAWFSGSRERSAASSSAKSRGP